ncbi:MAG: TonB-dependent receptor plug domain-containing protein, partial [Candidatus Krumholzibacteria bacterium]|nr:TonB-dependent receptor plug domain-containing protein [Candidatus Krumholzibacteria bacterium]
MSHPNFLGKGAAVLAALLIFAPIAAAEDHLASFIIVEGDTLWVTETLEVLGSRVPVALPGVVRTMNVVMEGEAEMAAARSVGELLQTVPGVVVSQRQQYGVQSDLTVRGSTFDQVQV